MFKFDKCSASKFYVAPSVERVVEFTPTGIDMENIAKVLSLAVDAKCVSCEVADGYADVNGRANFRLIYLDRDGNPKGVDYNADFSVRVDGEFAAGDNVSCSVHVVESDVEAADALKLSAVLEIVVSATRREELEMLVDAEKCYKTMRSIYLPSFIASKTAGVSFDSEEDVGAEISAVLGMSANCMVKEAIASNGSANIKAGLYATVTYSEDGQIKQRDFDIPIEDDFNIDGLEVGDTLSVQCVLKSSKIILQGVTDDNVIRVEGEVQFKIQAFRCSQIEIVSDMFTLANEVEIQRDSFDLICFDGCGYFSERVSGTAMLGDNRPGAMTVAALPYARCYTSRAFVNEDGKLVVEGVVNTDIIYTDENGYNSVRTEVPFSLVLAGQSGFSQDVRVHCGVESIFATVKREREFDIEMILGVEVCGFSPVKSEYISAVEIGEEKVQNTSALSLYIANEGDEMLDVCKALTAMPEEILAQNPDLETPLKEGTRIVYFRSIQ